LAKACEQQKGALELKKHRSCKQYQRLGLELKASGAKNEEKG